MAEGSGIAPFGTPKPERLLERILDLTTNPNDLVLDSFLGSGTTAAVAHKMGRRWIGIEMGEHAVTHCLPRLQKVVEGEQGGISKAVNWQGGGGFRMLSLGAPLFGADGEIDPEVRFADLAAFLWMRETGGPLDRAAAGSGLPLIGVHAPDAGRAGTAYCRLFNGILGDRRPAGPPAATCSPAPCSPRCASGAGTPGRRSSTAKPAAWATRGSRPRASPSSNCRTRCRGKLRTSCRRAP